MCGYGVMLVIYMIEFGDFGFVGFGICVNSCVEFEVFVVYDGVVIE